MKTEKIIHDVPAVIIKVINENKNKGLGAEFAGTLGARDDGASTLTMLEDIVLLWFDTLKMQEWKDKVVSSLSSLKNK